MEKLGSANDPAEGRMGDLRVSKAERALEKAKYGIDPDLYKSTEGEHFLDAINWRGLQEMFESLARKIDPEREKQPHIAERDDVYFIRMQELAIQDPPSRLIGFDFDGIRSRARKFENPAFEDLYVLKVLLHEEAHIAAGGETGRVLGSIGQGWLDEGLDELIAQHLMPEYVRRYGFKNYTVEDVNKFLVRNQLEGDFPNYDMAAAFLEGIIAIFAHDYASPPDNREQVFNGFVRAHFRDANLLAEEYRNVFSVVLGEDKMSDIAHATSGRMLLGYLTDSQPLMKRLQEVDAPLADRLKMLAQKSDRNTSPNTN